MIQLYNDDCMHIFNQIPDCSIDLLITDCPYHIVDGGCCTDKTKNKVTGGILSGRNSNGEHVKKGKIFEFNKIEFSEWMPQAYRVLKPNTHAYIMINPRNLKDLWECAEQAGFNFQNILIWDKGNVTPNRFYMQGYEIILMLRKGKAKSINNKGTSNILRIPNIRGNKFHPTEKPVELMQILIENSTQKGDVVMDPFCGAGAVPIACKETGRGCIGVEIDVNYYTIAKSRIENTNKKQITFDDLGGM